MDYLKLKDLVEAQVRVHKCSHYGRLPFQTVGAVFDDRQSAYYVTVEVAHKRPVYFKVAAKTRNSAEELTVAQIDYFLADAEMACVWINPQYRPFEYIRVDLLKSSF